MKNCCCGINTQTSQILPAICDHPSIISTWYKCSPCLSEVSAKQHTLFIFSINLIPYSVSFYELNRHSKAALTDSASTFCIFISCDQTTILNESNSGQLLIIISVILLNEGGVDYIHWVGHFPFWMMAFSILFFPLYFPFTPTFIFSLVLMVQFNSGVWFNLRCIQAKFGQLMVLS